jgi:hypothetical protein
MNHFSLLKRSYENLRKTLENKTPNINKKTQMKQLKEIVILSILTLVFSACSHSPENLTVIPEETNAIAVIDFYSIIKKGQLDKLSELKMFKRFKKEIRNENKKISKIIDNIVEDPTLSGINITTDLFAYILNDSNDEQFLCFSAELNDEEKFSIFLDDILDESDIDYDIEKEKTYNYTLIGNDAAIGWDQNKTVLIVASNYKSRENLDLEIETLMELGEKELITTNENFNNFYKTKKDISVWLSTNLFEDIREFKKLEKEIDYDLTDNYISSYLNFDNNDISLLTEFTPNSDIKKLMDENDIYNNTFNAQLLNYFPNENYATASMSINPMSFYDILKKEDGFDEQQTQFEKNTDFELKEIFVNIKGNAVCSLFGFETIEYTYNEWGYGFNEGEAELLNERYPISEAGYISSENRELLNQGKTIQANSFSKKYCINIKNILDNGGTIETAINNDSEINWFDGGWDYGKYLETTREDFLPLVGMAIDINGNDMVKELMDKIPEESITKHDDYYEFLFDNRYPTYFAFNNDVCFITNDKKSIKAFEDGGYSTNSLSQSSISSNITTSNLYTFLNLNYDDYSKDIKNEVNAQQNENEAKMLDIWADFAESIELKQINKNSVEIIFKTKDTERNSLNTIISTIDKNHKFFMSM